MGSHKIRFASFLLTLFFIAGAKLQAQISIAEKQFQNLPKVKFSNYSGPVKQTYNVQDIIAIGTALAADFKDNKGVYADGRYEIRRIISSSNDLYSADIFILGATAQANHIKTLNRILSAYVRKQFNYTQKQADTLAQFILNYNALKRGDMEHVKANYAKEVVDFVDPAKVGIALSYRNWPGNTQVLLPLIVSGIYGKRLDSKELYKETVENLQGKPDKGVEEREKMLDVMKKDLAEKENALQQQRLEKQKEIEKTQGDIKNLKEAEPSVKRDIALNAKNEELARKQQEQSELNKEAEKLSEEKKEIEQAEAQLQKDKAEVNPSGQESAKYLYYLKLVGPGRDAPLKQLVSVDKEQMEVFRTKDAVAGQNLLLFQGGVVAVFAGAPPSTTLTLFDGDTLDVLKNSKQTVYPLTHTALDAGFIYAVFEKSKKYYLGKFDSELALKAVSSEGIYQNSDIVVAKDGIYVTVVDQGTRKVAVLKKDDLTTVKILKQ
jgi:hypothetical protein